METLERKIISVLKESPTPLTAAEIAKHIHCTKKEINQKIYDIKEVEIVKEGTGPPKWRLDERYQTKETSEAVAVETPTKVPVSEQKSTDAEIKSEVVRHLQSLSSSISAPQIARSISDRLDNVINADVKRVLGELEREGTVRNHSSKGQKPLWSLKKSTPTKSEFTTLEGRRIMSMQETENGGFIFDPIPKDQLHEASQQKPEQAIKTNKTTTSVGDDHKSLPYIPPVGPSIPPVGPSIPPVGHSIPPVGPSIPPVGPSIPPVGPSIQSDDSSIQSVESSTQSIEPVIQAAIVPTEACKKKNPVVRLAANFDELSVKDEEQSDEELYEQVLGFLKSHPREEFTAHAIARSFGHFTRQKIVYTLDRLVEEGVVEKMNDNAYSIRKD